MCAMLNKNFGITCSNALVLIWTHRRSRRRRRCGKCEAGRLKCPTPNICPMETVWGKTQEIPSFILATLCAKPLWEWVLRYIARSGSSFCCLASFDLLTGGEITAIDSLIHPETKAERQNTMTERRTTGLGNCTSLRPRILTGTL